MTQNLWPAVRLVSKGVPDATPPTSIQVKNQPTPFVLLDYKESKSGHHRPEFYILLAPLVWFSWFPTNRNRGAEHPFQNFR